MAKNRQDIWEEVERQFHAAMAREDETRVAACLKYAAWTLHPTPQAKTISDVSEQAAHLLYRHADELQRWLDRYDFMVAQKGLRFHLGDQKYSEFEARFLEETERYPRGKTPKEEPA